MLDSEARTIAAQAWAQVKSADDPGFEACAEDHKSKLAYKVQNVAKSGTREDAFDEAVHAILNAPLALTEPEAPVEAAQVEAAPEPAPEPKPKRKRAPKTAPKAVTSKAKK